MSKGQRGNKEARKPKKLQPAGKPATPGEMPTLGGTAPPAPKKK